MAAADVVGTGQEDTAVDEASVLAQIRRFLMCPSEREAAGTLLWDLSAGANLANTMVHAGKVFDVVEAVLAEQLAGSDGGNSNAHQGAQTEEASMNGAAGHEVAIVDAAEAEQRYQRQRERVMEICVGIIGNLSSHAHLAVVLAKEHPALVELLTEGLMLCSSSTPILTELCRLGSVALRMPGAEVWLAHLSATDMASHLLFVLDNTLDSQLHARCLDLLVALVWCEQQRQRQQEQHKEPSTAQEGGINSQADTSQPNTTLGPAALTLLSKGLVPLLAAVLRAAVFEFEDGAGEELGSSHISATSVDAALRMLELLNSYPRPWPQPLVQALSACPGLLPTAVRLLECEPGLEVVESLVVLLSAIGPPALPLLSSDLGAVLALLACLGEVPADAHELRAAILQLVAHALYLRCSPTQPTGPLPSSDPGEGAAGQLGQGAANMGSAADGTHGTGIAQQQGATMQLGESSPAGVSGSSTTWPGLQAEEPQPVTMRQLRQLVEQLSSVHDDVVNTLEQHSNEATRDGVTEEEDNVPAEGSKAAETLENLHTSLRAVRSSVAAVQQLMAAASSSEASANPQERGGDAIDRLLTSQARHISGVAQQLQALLQSINGRSAVSHSA